jgi:hypothetical protein
MNEIIIKKVSNKYVDISLSKNKYPIFDKIKNEHLEFVISEIIELGYNQYMKNLIKSDLQLTNNQNNQINTINSITESKYSSIKGSQGENIVIDILIDKFTKFISESR